MTFFLQGLEGDRKQLTNLEERHAVQEREVKRFEERRAIEQKVGIPFSRMIAGQQLTRSTKDCSSGDSYTCQAVYGGASEV